MSGTSDHHRRVDEARWQVEARAVEARAVEARIPRRTAEAQVAVSRAEQAEGRHDALLAGLAGGGFTATGGR